MKTPIRKQKKNSEIKKGGFSEYVAGNGGGAAASGSHAFGLPGNQVPVMPGSNALLIHSPVSGGNMNLIEPVKMVSEVNNNAQGMMGPIKVGGKNKKCGGNSSNLAKIAVPALLTYATTMIAPRSRKTYKGYKGSRSRFSRSRRFSRRNR
jgi:hypothetical protein